MKDVPCQYSLLEADGMLTTMQRLTVPHVPCAAPPILFNRWSYAGWLTALVQALPTKAVVGIFYIIGASLWTLESVLSVWTLQLVRRSPLIPKHAIMCHSKLRDSCTRELFTLTGCPVSE